MEIENKYLCLKDLEKIKNHSYKSTGYSKLDNLMNPFWTWCADILPTVSIDLLKSIYYAKDFYNNENFLIFN